MTISPDELDAFMHEQVSIAVRELFESLDPSAVVEGGPHSHVLNGEWLISVMGFGGELLRGALCLAVSAPAARALVPEGMSAEGAEEIEMIRDVVGEYSNMLAGRLKNLLLPRGITLMLALPATTHATDVRLPRPGSTPLSLAVRIRQGTLFVQLEVTAERELSLLPCSQPDGLREGDFLTL